MTGRILLLVALPIAGAVAWLAVRERGQPTGVPPAGAADWQSEIGVEVQFVNPADAPALLANFGASVVATARKIFRLPADAAPYADTIARAEKKYGIPETLLGRLLYQESRYRPEVIDGRKRSSAGAIGIAQFMPATAAEWGIDPRDPTSAIPGAARYLRWLYDQLGDWRKTLAAYNWGIGNVQRRGLDAAPPETQAYLRDILADVDVS